MTLQLNKGSVKRFGKLAALSNFLQKLPDAMIPAPFRLIQIGSAFWQSRALYVAVKLDIASILADESLTAETIADRVSAQEDAIYRLMRMLAAIGVFQEIAPRMFKNNRLSAYLRTDNPKNVRAMILMHNSPEMSKPWFQELEQGVRSGAVPFELSYDQALYTYMDRHADFDALFASAMDCVESLAGDSFASDLDWRQFNRIIDIGGSNGSKSLAILKRHPHLTALVFDREQIIRNAKAHWANTESSELLSRLRYRSGDLLDDLPVADNDKDIYLLSAVLHSLDDETCIRILIKLSNACRNSGARIAIMEMVVPEQNADFSIAAFDMQMFVGTRGRERTLTEWMQLFKHAGLRIEEQVGLQSFAKILVLTTDTH